MNNNNRYPVERNSFSQFLRNPLQILRFIVFIFIASLWSCEGPAGPMGPPGEPGGLEYAKVYEIEGDFLPDNNYRLGFQFPGEGIYKSDVVLVYLLWEQADGLDVWRQLPQTVVSGSEGIIQYNFDYSFIDVQLFLEFTVPEASLRPAETLNQVFRIVVVPAELLARSNADISSFDSLLANPEIRFEPMERLDLLNIQN